VPLAVNPAETLGLAAAGLWLAAAIHRRIPFLDRLHIPQPITAGLLLAFSVLACKAFQLHFTFDTTLRDLSMVAFFTTVGLNASTRLLKLGGLQVLVCLALAAAAAEMQNGIGILLAKLLGINPLAGIMAGAATLAGGPATALAFGQTFEKLGLQDAQTIGLACAVFGILTSGIIGGALGGWLIQKHNLKTTPAQSQQGRELQHGRWLWTLSALLIAMAAGSLISKAISAAGLTLPGYIGAMIAAALIRLADDRKAQNIDEPALALTARLTLAVFIVTALLSLNLSALANLAIPLLAILSVQLITTTLFAATLVYKYMGRDYEAAVSAAGWTGFMIGTTANAVASMDTLTARYGPAPKSYTAVPVTGAFLIDFTNSLIILTGADLVRRFL
jgi:glutamate:Na+ symporter, ESS family